MENSSQICLVMLIAKLSDDATEKYFARTI